VRETLAVFRKEMRAYLVSPIPYLVVAVFAVFSTWLVFDHKNWLLFRQPNLEFFFSTVSIPLMVLVPAIAMRLWSEEIRGGTFETLLTLPVRVRHLVVGKWLAAWVVVGVCLAATAGIPITGSSLGDLDSGPMWGGYLGAWLLGGSFLAIGLWLSAMTSNQIVAFILGVVACTAFTYFDFIGERFGEGGLGGALTWLSASTHFQAIARGVVDVRDLAYFASLVAFFLYLNTETVENRRFR
jgi:ABC-2 type transport system permease protein